MKRFSKDQIMFFVFSFIIVLLLAYKTIGFDFIVSNGPQQLKYQSYVDSVSKLEQKLASYQDSNMTVKRDIFNPPNLPKPVVQATVQVANPVAKVQKNYSYSVKILPWDRDKLELVLTVEGKAKISVAGAIKLYTIGEQIQCASSTSIEIDEATGEPTGKAKDNGTITGTITSIDKKNVYISLPGSNQAVRLNARDGAKLMDRDFIPQQSKDTQDNSGGETTPKVKKQR